MSSSTVGGMDGAGGKKSRREEYSEATRRALLAEARLLFTRDGYQATGIEAVVRASRVTRGALYHHFEDKRALFDALVVQLQQEAAERVAASAAEGGDRWSGMRLGMAGYLDASRDPAYLRLVIQEGPAVLGMARYREIDETYPLALFIAALASARRAGELAFDDIPLLAHLIASMMCQAALLMASADDPAATRALSEEAIYRMLESFRRTAGGER